MNRSKLIACIAPLGTILLAGCVLAAAWAYGRMTEVHAVRFLTAIVVCASLVLLLANEQLRRLALDSRTRARRQAAAYRELCECLPIGLYRFGSDGFSFVNPAWNRMHGRSDRKPPAAAWRSRVHPDDLAACEAAYRTAFDQSTPIELHYRTAGDAMTERHLVTYGVPSASGEPDAKRFLGFTLDETDAVAARLELEVLNAEFDAKNRELEHALGELEESVQGVVRSLVRAVEAKDPYTAGHSERVMLYAVRLGRLMGLGELELRVLGRGCLVHDVGKIGIPDDILRKPDRLTEGEFAMIREHPLIGERILSDVKLFSGALSIVRSHHERLDGTGYPDRLYGDQIPLLVRISSVADAFDAMTSNRAYRHQMAATTAIAQLGEDAISGKLDLAVVELMTEMILSEGLLEATRATLGQAA